MQSSVKKFKTEHHLFILPSGNVINKNSEGIEEEKYLSSLSALLGASYNVTFIQYPKRRTVLYSSAYFKRKAAVNLAQAIDNAREKNVVLLGISAGADVVMKYLAGNNKKKISKAICAGLFTGAKRKVRTNCGKLIFLYGEEDLIGIKSVDKIVVLKPANYARGCIENISASQSTNITYKIIAGCSHTLLSEKRKNPALILKKFIVCE